MPLSFVSQNVQLDVVGLKQRWVKINVLTHTLPCAYINIKEYPIDLDFRKLGND